MIQINGKTYQGNNITMKNGKVFIDGKPADTGKEKTINVVVHGPIDVLEIDTCNVVTVNGNVGDIKNGAGDLTVNGSVFDKIKSGAGDIEVEGDVNGNVETGAGDFTVKGNVYGKVKTGAGDFKGKKVYIER